MGRPPSEQGKTTRRRILAELVRRYLEFEVPISVEAMANLLDVRPGTLRFHVDRLRMEGLVHLEALWITRSGFEKVTAETTYPQIEA